MPYVVYVNHPNNKAIVHNINCGKYTNRKRNETHNGFWSDAFETLDNAKKYSTETGKKNIDTCAFCVNER